MGASITLAGEQLIAQKQGEQKILDVSRFIFANVPGLDPTRPVDRAAPKPPAAQIVYSEAIPAANRGYVNPNQVVYSLQVASDIGDWDFNWIGLESAEGVLFAVSYVPLQQKRRNIPPNQVGNNLTRNFLVVYDGAQALTGITIDATTWQHDFTVRLHGIDERERLSNRDIFGRACFLGSALQLQKVGNTYQLQAGTAYVEGIRVFLSAAQTIAPPMFPVTVGLDVALDRELNTVVARWKPVFGGQGSDSVDANGIQHYWVPLAYLSDSNTVIDWRATQDIQSPLVEHFAARSGDYTHLRARATTKDDVGLGNLPNATSDNPGTNSSFVLATSRAVYSAFTSLAESITRIVTGETTVGNATRLATARKLGITGAATGSTSFDGQADASIELTLADSGAKAGTYTKVNITAKGLVAAGEQLKASDIPELDFSKITSGTPTTLAGYGITDALKVGTPSNQRPVLTSPVEGTTYQHAALEIREAKLVQKGSTDLSYAPAIAFHWGGLVAERLAMDSSRNLYWGSGLVYHSENLKLQTVAGTQLNQDLVVRTVNNYVEVSAREILLKNAVGMPKLIRNVGVSAILSVTGAGGADTGFGRANTWYYIWVVEGDAAPYALMSTSNAAPAGVSEDVYRALVGAVRNDGSGNLVPFYQVGKKVSLRPQLVFTGVVPPANYTAVSLAAMIPPIAKSARGIVGSNTGGTFFTERCVAGDPYGMGACCVGLPGTLQLPVEGYLSAGHWDVPIIYVQTIYWYGPDNVNPEGRMHVCGYEI
ncbi:hypothetical protein A7318_19980 [Pseudomonas lurida]|uniref:phage tail-collar fiber domain-containing protein n=1 Tax=Pseudomonas lurida TaxID=244566 RepID=UPI00083E4DDE|nr:phage tail protein [Pseudomonas lurida]AOE80772.1 hypothetical protein A7318_19980 [Pseudomonas lurida]